MITNVPSPVFTPSGFKVPAASKILAGVLVDMDLAFGGGMNLNQEENPLGQLATSSTAIIADKDDQILSVSTQVDPAFAAGRMQDAIGRIYFITRFPATETSIAGVTCLGRDGVVIPSGSQIKGSDGETYQALSSGIITNGSVVIPFSNILTGPISCGVGALDTRAGAQMISSVPGWDSAINLVPGVLGNNVESRAQFEERRTSSVAKNAQGSIESVRGAVLAVPGVLDAYVTQNTLSTPSMISGVIVPPHSLYVSAIGGDSDAIIQAIWLKKSLGCGTGGSTSRQITDTAYDAPRPTYVISYQIPIPVAVFIKVILADGPLIPTNALQLIQDACLTAFAGADGGSRARIGQRLLASRFYAPIFQLGPWAQVVGVTLGLALPDQPSVQVPIDQVLTIVPGNISLETV